MIAGFHPGSEHRLAMKIAVLFRESGPLLARLTLLATMLPLFGTTVQSAEPDWVLEGKAAWQARDSQGEWVFRDRMWIGGGWFDSFAAPPRDVWSTADGKQWTLVEKAAPWIHSDLPMSLTFGDRMWLMGGWYNGRLPGHSASREVWSSNDGAIWTQATAAAAWSARCAGAVVEHRGRMWLLGGIENYYFGDDKSVKKRRLVERRRQGVDSGDRGGPLGAAGLSPGRIPQ
jgi:hypothetical protein